MLASAQETAKKVLDKDNNKILPIGIQLLFKLMLRRMAAVGLVAEGLVELLDDGGDAGDLLRVPGHNDRAGLGVDGDRGAFLRPAVGVIADERARQDLGDLVGLGRLDLEDACGGALRADLVELLDDGFHDVEFGSGGGDDQAVGIDVRDDRSVGGGGAGRSFDCSW